MKKNILQTSIMAGLLTTSSALAFDPGAAVVSNVVSGLNNNRAGAGGGAAGGMGDFNPNSADAMHGKGAGAPTCAPIPTLPAMEPGKCIYIDKMYNTVLAECNTPLLEGPFVGLPPCKNGKHPYSSYWENTQGVASSASSKDQKVPAKPKEADLAVKFIASDRATCTTQLREDLEVADWVDGDPSPEVFCGALFHVEGPAKDKFEIVRKAHLKFKSIQDCEKRVDAIRADKLSVRYEADGRLAELPATNEFCSEIYSGDQNAIRSISAANKNTQSSKQSGSFSSSLGEVEQFEVHFGAPQHSSANAR